MYAHPLVVLLLTTARQLTLSTTNPCGGSLKYTLSFSRRKKKVFSPDLETQEPRTVACVDVTGKRLFAGMNPIMCLITSRERERERVRERGKESVAWPKKGRADNAAWSMEAR